MNDKPSITIKPTKNEIKKFFENKGFVDSELESFNNFIEAELQNIIDENQDIDGDGKNNNLLHSPFESFPGFSERLLSDQLRSGWQGRLKPRAHQQAHQVPESYDPQWSALLHFLLNWGFFTHYALAFFEGGTTFRRSFGER